MKKTTSKKLALSRTTVRSLGAPQLERLVGGQTIATCSDLCTSPQLCNDTHNLRWCNLDTQFVHGCAG